MTTYQPMSSVPINQWVIAANDIGEFYCRSADGMACLTAAGDSWSVIEAKKGIDG